jgi:lipid II:glycine glycyltransferase (peptidoglycan interpeptide bridge formation enzyme)
MGWASDVSARSRQDPSRVGEAGPYSVRISDEPDDADWDDFLEQVPIGHHAQTSCWGRVRASIGWRPVRIVVSDGARVVAGAQMVTRRMPAGGNLGFVCRGPVVQEGYPDLTRLVFDEMMAMGRQHGVQYLVVQPPPGCDWMSEQLKRRRFGYGAFDIDDTATILMDLRPDLDDLFARIRRQRRQNIRTAERRGVTVRQGSEADLPIFNRLMDAHSARLGYARRGEGYYTELWRAFAPRGHIELFIAEYEGEPVSALLAIPFGDTSRHMERPWSGEHGELRTNDLIEWEAIRWAKSEGCRFVDLGGIDRPIAVAILSGKGDSVDPNTAAFFKLKWGGHVIIDPPSFDYVYNPVLRFAYRCIPNSVMRSASMRGFLFRFREAG